MNKLKFGVIGAGSIGSIHAGNVKRNRSTELVAICDIREDRARKLARKLKVQKTYTNYLDMLDKEKLDAVISGTPNYLHAKIAIDALERGVNVLTEKPMAMNAQEAQAMVDAAKRTGKVLALGMTQRFTAEGAAAKAASTPKNLGSVYFAKATLYRTLGIPGFRSWFTTKAQSGGGPLMDLGPHAIDFAMYLMNFPKPLRARGVTYSKLGPRGLGLGTWGHPEREGVFDVEDLAVALVELAGGITMLVEVSWATYTDEYWNVHVLGDKAGITYRPPHLISERRGKLKVTNLKVKRVKPYMQELEDLVQCIRTGKEPLGRPEDGVVVMKIIDAIYKSAEMGSEVPVE
jgi:predicted dehydrogenase